MDYFIDTKFIDNGKTIDLISIGLVCEDGRELYLGNKNCDFVNPPDWIIENVLIPMGFEEMPKRPWVNEFICPIDPGFWVTKTKISEAVQHFCDPTKYGKPIFWGYHADYDWVVFCQLFGGVFDLPNRFPMYCRDLRQDCDRLSVNKLPKRENGHNALEEARWCKTLLNFLRKEFSNLKKVL